MLREEVRKFLDWYGIPKIKFAFKAGISYTTLQSFLQGRTMSDETIHKISACLEQYKILN